MKVQETDYNYIKVPKEAVSIGALPGRGWSVPIEFPVPVRINNHSITHFNLSEYGAIRFSAAKTGRYTYMAGDRQLPSSIFDTDDGYMIVPWGELQVLKTCGIDVKMFETNGTVVINYETRSAYSDAKYLYQVQFDVRKPNAIEAHYYHCVTGYTTFIGAVLEPDNYVDWGLKEDRPYMKKALRFIIDSAAEEPIVFGPTKPIVPVSDWGTLHKSATIWLQSRT